MIECFIILPEKTEILSPLKLTHNNCLNIFEDLNTVYDFRKKIRWVNSKN